MASVAIDSLTKVFPGGVRALDELIGITQRLDVVKYPDAATVGGGHQITLMHSQVAHRGGRQIQLQGLPGMTVIE